MTSDSPETIPAGATRASASVTRTLVLQPERRGRANADRAAVCGILLHLPIAARCRDGDDRDVAVSPDDELHASCCGATGRVRQDRVYRECSARCCRRDCRGACRSRCWFPA